MSGLVFLVRCVGFSVSYSICLVQCFLFSVPGLVFLVQCVWLSVSCSVRLVQCVWFSVSRKLNTRLSNRVYFILAAFQKSRHQNLNSFNPFIDKMNQFNKITRLNLKSGTSHGRIVSELILKKLLPMSSGTPWIYQLIGLVGRVFANGPGDLCSVLGCVIPKTLKMVLNTSLLSTQQYKVHIKGRVELSRERSSALPYTSV